MKRKINIAVIIPTFNGGRLLLKCLDSINAETVKINQIIVIDNASTDNTLKLLKSRKDIVLLPLKRNRGVSVGRNAGISLLNKDIEYVIFVDHDMVLKNNCIEELIKPFKAEHVGVTTPKIFYADNPTRIWAAGTNIDLNTGKVLFRGGEDKGQFEDDMPVQVAPAVICVKRKLLSESHGFSPKYFATFEDTDFCIRLKSHGHITMYAHSAVAWHYISSDKNAERKRLVSRIGQIATNRLLFIKNYGKSLPTFLLSWPLLSLYYCILALKEKDKLGIKKYIEGTVKGIVEIIRQIYWPYSYKWILSRVTQGDIHEILDIGCGKGDLAVNLWYSKKIIIDGIELNKEASQEAMYTGLYRQIYVKDLTKKEKINSQRHDLVFCSQVVEHLDKFDAVKLISSLELLAKKKVVITTTNGKFDYKPLGKSDLKENPLQHHRSGWTVNEFRSKGYTVYGQGVKIFYGDRGLVHRYPNLFPIWAILSYITAPVAYYIPQTATYLISYKNVHG